MCELCNGTHVIHASGIYMAFIRTCPTCGPKSTEHLAVERKERLQRLADAKTKYKMDVVP